MLKNLKNKIFLFQLYDMNKVEKNTKKNEEILANTLCLSYFNIFH